MKRLAAYAALLAVPTMIAGIYGMNFEHMPELKWRFGYELSLFVMAALGCLSLCPVQALQMAVDKCRVPAFQWVMSQSPI